jgi:DNA-binding MarR family transcriptional regulator
MTDAGGDGGADGDPSTPLARLFALAYRQLVDDMHDRLIERGWVDVRRSYGFVLLALRERETTTTELAGLLGESKQATSKLLDAMERDGYVQRAGGAADARVKVVALAERGGRLLAAVEEIYAELERQWVTVIGADAVQGIRAGLLAVLHERHGVPLPQLRPPD